jgi:hypothetical protein
MLAVLLCAVLRVTPHSPNFAPAGATAVFAGRTLPAPMAISVTLVPVSPAETVLL